MTLLTFKLCSVKVISLFTKTRILFNDSFTFYTRSIRIRTLSAVKRAVRTVIDTILAYINKATIKIPCRAFAFCLAIHRINNMNFSIVTFNTNIWGLTAKARIITDSTFSPWVLIISGIALTDPIYFIIKKFLFKFEKNFSWLYFIFTRIQYSIL